MDTGLQPGEFQLGRYKVRYAVFSSLGWAGRGPWMRAIVTNRRFILIPDDVHKEGNPLVISSNAIRRAWSICLGRRDGALVALSNGQLLYFLIDWGQGAHMVKDIRDMLTPPAQPTIAPRLYDKRYLN